MTAMNAQDKAYETAEQAIREALRAGITAEELATLVRNAAAEENAR